MEKIKFPINRLKVFLYIICGLSLVAHHTSAQDISKTNLAHVYDFKAETFVDYSVVSNGSETIIFLKVMVDNTAGFMDDYTVGYQVKENYDNEQPPFTFLTAENILKQGEALIFRVTIPATTEEMLCVIKITNIGTRRDFYYDIPIRNKSSFNYARFYMKEANEEKPIFDPYLPVGTTVKFASPQSIDKIYGFKYSVDFDAALPPMATSKAPSSKSMTIDSVFQINLDEPFNLAEEGLYFFQDDTTAFEGLSLHVTNRHYPKLARIEDLSASIVYLSTRLEYKSLNNAENKKKAMDSFWLKIAGSRDKAKRIIRNYYQNVELANRIFTNYKAGWKTDKGIIYIIYGPPSEVYRNEFEEVWIYERQENLSRIRFSFTKVKSIFTKDHYELSRDRSYEKFWYRIIDLWRKGRKGI